MRISRPWPLSRKRRQVVETMVCNGTNRIFDRQTIGQRGAGYCGSPRDTACVQCAGIAFTNSLIASVASRWRSGLGHPLHTHIHEPSTDVCRVEPHATADTKAGNRSPFCSTENRQSRDLQQICEFLCGHGMVNCLNARGERHELIRTSLS